MTSRRSHWGVASGINSLELGVLSPVESHSLLRKFRPDISEGDKDLLDIAELLGHLPLALHLAGSFLRRYRNTSQGIPGAYLANLQRPDLLSHCSMCEGETSPTGHDLHVAKTFAISFDQLQPQEWGDSFALNILSISACFSPGEPIPRSLLQVSNNVVNTDDDIEMHINDALVRLNDLGLISLENQGDAVIHSLLSRYVRQAVADFSEIKNLVEKSILSEAQKINQAELPEPLIKWQAHLRYLTEDACSSSSQYASELLLTLGYHLLAIAQYVDAKDCFIRCIEMEENRIIVIPSIISACSNNLVEVYSRIGNPELALPYAKKALKMDQDSYPENHTIIGLRLSTLGGVHTELGDLTSKHLYAVPRMAYKCLLD